MMPNPLFFPFALLYGIAVWLRNLFFEIGLLKIVDVGKPVISVGNLTAGGTGKTPHVIAIAEILMKAEKRVAILSRGHGRETKGTVVVCDGTSVLTDSRTAGDEALLIAQRLKNAVVIVDENRVRGARFAIRNFQPDVFILDDGFQHRYIKRNSDIVLIHRDQSPFKTMLLPAGYRREFVSALQRADAIVVTKTDKVGDADNFRQQRNIADSAKIFSSAMIPRGFVRLFDGVPQSMDMMRGRSAIAVCGIADPKSFRQTLESCGVTVVEMLTFGDHHQFSTADLARMITSFRQHQAEYVLTTEKDAVRLIQFRKELESIPIAALVIDIVVHQQDEWKKYIISRVAA